MTVARHLSSFGLFLGALSTALFADSVTFTGQGVGATGNKLNAAAVFELTGTNLKITLTEQGSLAGRNTKFAKSDLLYGLFFGSSSIGTLTGGNASGGSTLDFSNHKVNCGKDCDVDEGWGVYNSTSYKGMQNSIRSASFSGFKENKSNFGGTHKNLGGADYGIASSNLKGPNQVAGLGGTKTISVGTVVFTLTVANGFRLSSIDRVGFQYGTKLNDSFIVAVVPEPAYVAVLVVGFAGLWAFSGRRRRSQ